MANSYFSIVTIVFYTLAFVLIYFSYRSFRGGIEFLNYFKSELAKPRSDNMPVATVICPCKGIDGELEENLTVLFEQDYPEYEIVFVVDNKDDPAVGIIEEVSRKDVKAAKISKLVVAPKAFESSQKVVNLREAVLNVDPTAEVFAFVDSDVLPSKVWLANLVAPLQDKNIGATTGYRWFISKNPTFASELRNIWNASIASALGPNANDNFCWGGSMAIRRETFETLEIREKWQGTLSDDFTIMHALRAENLPIHFVPRALSPSIDDCTFREMFEFTTRQMKITRVYAQKFWLMSFFGSALFCIVMSWAFWIVIASRQNTFEVWTAISTVVLVSIFSSFKSLLRLRAVRLIIPEFDKSLRAQILPQMTLWLLSPFVFLVNSIFALFSRRISWRGITYEMVSPQITRIVSIKNERRP